MFYKPLGIQLHSQMIGMSNHLLSTRFRFHYHSHKVIGSLGNNWRERTNQQPKPRCTFLPQINEMCHIFHFHESSLCWNAVSDSGPSAPSGISHGYPRSEVWEKLDRRICRWMRSKMAFFLGGRHFPWISLQKTRLLLHTVIFLLQKLDRDLAQKPMV